MLKVFLGFSILLGRKCVNVSTVSSEVIEKYYYSVSDVYDSNSLRQLKCVCFSFILSQKLKNCSFYTKQIFTNRLLLFYFRLNFILNIMSIFLYVLLED